MSRLVRTLIVAALFSTPVLLAQEMQMSTGPEAPSAIAAAATSQSISYQGSLIVSGSPATGTYDFEFKLLDAPTGGTQLGLAYIANDVPVSNGIFATEVTFGVGFFWQGVPYIQVGVRPGASGGAFTSLGDPTKILATPLALALPGFHVNQSQPFHGIGRSARLTTQEVFGVHSPTSSGYGGMYLSTEGASGKPFYGYAVGGITKAWHYYDVSKWKLYNGGSTRLTVQSDGFVGIGTESPNTLLHVDGSNADVTIGNPAAEHMLLEGNIGSGSIVRLYNSGDVETVRINSHGSNSAGEMFLYSEAGQARIELDAEVTGGGFARFTNSSNTATIDIRAEEVAGQGGEIKIKNAAGATTIELDGDFGSGTGNPGRIISDELELNGSDLAENFDVNTGPSVPTIEAGMLVSIDPSDPGALTITQDAYDSKVVGIVSGAGGIRTGIYMGQEGTLANGEHPIAIAGRVYVHATTANGKIRPGDLMTTSARPGYAMKVSDPDDARGAIIGKAMTGLDADDGLVLLFISLQ